jgi:hypothetical protein
MKKKFENTIEYREEFKETLKNRLEVMVVSRYHKPKKANNWLSRLGYFFVILLLIGGINLVYVDRSPSIENEFNSTLAEFDLLISELDRLDFDSPDLSEI